VTQCNVFADHAASYLYLDDLDPNLTAVKTCLVYCNLVHWYFTSKSHFIQKKIPFAPRRLWMQALCVTHTPCYQECIRYFVLKNWRKETTQKT